MAGPVALLERHALSTRLAELLAGAAGGSGCLVLVTGEAGTGKSALVHDLCVRQAGGVRVLYGACEALRTPRPLGPLLDIARAAGGELARLVTAERPRHTIFTALLDVLASARPSIVVVEDVHWADEATCDLLLFVGRRIAELPALVLVTFRDEEVGPEHPLRVVLGDLASAPGVRRLPVPPLSPAGVAELAAPYGVDAGRLYEVTGGNPFFVTEVLGAPGQAVPLTVRDAVLARAARLSPPARRALDAVAVLPDRATLAVLLAAGAGDPAHLDECAQAGMLLVDARTAAFRHELARVAVEQAIPPTRRAALHAAVLAALSAGPSADPARLAYHAEEAGDDAAVFAHAPVAARQAAALGAHREAAQHYTHALRAAAGGAPRDQAVLWERLATEYGATGRATEALAAADRALALWHAIGDREHEGTQLARRAGYLWHLGRTDEADDSVRAAIALLDGEPPGRGLAAAYAYRATLQMIRRDINGAATAGRTGIRLATAIGDNELLARALNAVGSAQRFTDPAEADRTMTRCLAVARESGDDHAVALAMVNYGSVAGEVRRYDLADRWLRETVDYTQARDLDANRLYSLAWLARTEFEQGRWPAASDLAMVAFARPADQLLTPGPAWNADLVAFTTLGRLRARRGDPDPAGLLDRAWEMAVETGHLQRLWPVAAGRAEAAWLAGRPEAVDELVAETFRLAVELGHPWAISELGYWLWMTGSLGTPPHGATGPYTLEMAGDPHGAARAWQELGCPYEAATALAGTGEPADLRTAHEQLGRLGAWPAADLLAQKLRGLGVGHPPRRPRRSTRNNPGHLTDRQVEILALLPTGLRNAEIATRLHISPKTVDHHVAAILAKLGVDSRRDAAHWAATHAVGGPER